MRARQVNDWIYAAQTFNWEHFTQRGNSSAWVIGIYFDSKIFCSGRSSKRNISSRKSLGYSSSNRRRHMEFSNLTVLKYFFRILFFNQMFSNFWFNVWATKYFRQGRFYFLIYFRRHRRLWSVKFIVWIKLIFCEFSVKNLNVTNNLFPDTNWPSRILTQETIN